MKLLLLSIVATCVASCVTIAAPSDSVHVMNHEFGLSVSSITGFGLSYKYNIDNQFYIKAIGYALPDNSANRSQLNTSIGGELQMNFVRTQNTRLYGFAGASFQSRNYEYTDTYNGNTATTFATDETTNYGAGFGFELAVWEHFTVSAMLGMQTMDVKYESTKYSTYYHPSSRTGMGGGIGFGYQF